MKSKFLLAILISLGMGAAASAQTDSLRAVYMARLDSVRTITRHQASTKTYNPYCIQLFAPGTLWHGTLHQMMTTGEEETSDPQLLMLQEINRKLANTYIRTPWLIGQTESELQAEESIIAPEVVEHKPEQTLKPKVTVAPDLTPTVDELAIKVDKPNFWKFSGDGKLQLTQNYFSDNWYQGGDNFYSMLTKLSLKVNYNNKQGLVWENLLEMQLGFQTNKGDTEHSFKTYSDQLRLTSKLNYKAAKNWNYAAQVQSWTQFMPSYNANANTYRSRFAAPLDVVVSLGMDWKVSLKRFNASLLIAPIAYSMRYISFRQTHSQDADIPITNHHGIDLGDHFKHNYGPNVQFKYTWNICQNVKWDARLYVLTDLHRVLGEWENTFTFSINKFLNSTLYIYPRYDDADPKYRNEHGRFVMFKEWLSLGLNYSW